MKRKSLLILLVALVIAVTAGGIWRLLWLGERLNADGPLALALAGDHGLYLATDTAILRFEANGNLSGVHGAASIGLRQPGALQEDENGNLWVFDKELRQIFRCSDWHCMSATPVSLDLDKNIQFSVNLQRQQIAVADNNRHRLLLLDLHGQLLQDSNDNPPLHYPNQINLGAHSLLIADTDRRNIINMALPDATSGGFGTPVISLHTRRRPYRFAHDAHGWWVLEAGETLFQGELVHYTEGGERREIATDAQDIVDMVDAGDSIIVASRSDYRLQAINKADGSQHDIGSEKLQAEWGRQRLQQAAWRGERRHIPLLMIVVLLPTLLGASVVQKQLVAEQEAMRAASTDRVVQPPASGYVVLRPDALARKTIRTEFIANLAASALAMAAIPGICWLAAGMPPAAAWGRQELRPLLVVSLLAVPLALASFVFAVMRRKGRLGGEIIFELKRAIFRRNGKDIAAAAYEDVKLTSRTLDIGGASILLYSGSNANAGELWPQAAIKAILDSRKGPGRKLAAKPGGSRLAMAGSEKTKVRRERWVARGLFALVLCLMAAMAYVVTSRGVHLGLYNYLRGGGFFLMMLCLFIFLERRSSGLLQREVLVHATKVVVLENGRPAIGGSPEQVFLGDRTLVVKSRGVPVLFQNGLGQRTEYLPVVELREVLSEVLPPGHVFSTDSAMLMALLKKRHPYAIVRMLLVIAAMVGSLIILWLIPQHRH